MTYTPRPLLRAVPYGSPEYHALHRELYRKPRRRDALDCERGPMPEDDAQDEPYEPAWAHRVQEMERASIAAARSAHAAVAWRGEDLGAAARAAGLSRERIRQIRADVRTRLGDRIDAALTELDREAAGPPARHGDSWDLRMDWWALLREQLVEYRWARYGGRDRRRRRSRAVAR